MGCVSSNLLNHDEDFPQIGGGSSAFGHHIVKLTSTTYGLLTLDPPPSPPPPSSAAFSSDNMPMTPPEKSKSLWSEPRLIKSEPEIINSWELMSGLDGESFRFTPLPKTPVKYKVFGGENKENSDPNRRNPRKSLNDEVLKPLDPNRENSDPNLRNPRKSLDLKLDEKFERICPPGGENRVVMYTTSLRGVRRTFEACNAVRAAVESLGVVVCERDVSMDRGFREELVSLMAKRVRDDGVAALPPRVFVKGMYIGGVEEVLRLVEEGSFGELIRGIPRKKADGACDGCGGLFFLPCFRCDGSCKMVKGWGSAAVVVRCSECNENGLVPCPICS
ncbi:Thioredoxin-like superfamily [Arabidopsis thaliana x Arabidopsis arenosa]|uniref:Thioredoxin-like superfamily n=1 Tax=Arabidopsis thaliana x Arabidopsis arenosa TaxID=1240361 RepID=A0A8T1Z1E5_9BRAS|nr:Thioredoxin-like superfamily [Arabidopsis thaliana x Arabidopsis arenosa]